MRTQVSLTTHYKQNSCYEAGTDNDGGHDTAITHVYNKTRPIHSTTEHHWNNETKQHNHVKTDII